MIRFDIQMNSSTVHVLILPVGAAHHEVAYLNKIRECWNRSSIVRISN